MMMAAPMSTLLFEFITLRYGNPTIRFCGVMAAISSDDIGVRVHAYGLSAATWLNRDHSGRRRCRGDPQVTC